MQEMCVQSLVWKDPLEKDMVTPSSIFAWEIPWTEEPGELQSKGSQKSQTRLSTRTHTGIFLANSRGDGIHATAAEINTTIVWEDSPLAHFHMLANGSSPQYFWHQGSVSWKTIFLQAGKGGWFGDDKHIAFTVPFISTFIPSAPFHIIRH